MTFDEYNEWLFKAANQFVALEDSIKFPSGKAGDDAWNAFQILKDMVNKIEEVEDDEGLDIGDRCPYCGDIWTGTLS